MKKLVISTVIALFATMFVWAAEHPVAAAAAKDCTGTVKCTKGADGAVTAVVLLCEKKTECAVVDGAKNADLVKADGKLVKVNGIVTEKEGKQSITLTAGSKVEEVKAVTAPLGPVNVTIPVPKK